MTNKILSYLPAAQAIAIVVLVLAMLFGGSAVVEKNLGGITNYDQVDAADGISIDGTIVIDGAGGLRIASGTVLTGNLSATGIRNSSGTTIGAGTVLLKTVCGTVTTSTADLVASSSITLVSAIGLSGATSSQSQVYFAGAASSTARGLMLGVNPGTTTGRVDLTLFNPVATTYASGTATYSACYTQF